MCEYRSKSGRISDNSDSRIFGENRFLRNGDKYFYCKFKME